jgi:hypothetical protein
MASTGRIRRWVVLAATILLSWIVAAVVVRIGLDWSDAFPYSAASEWRYLAVAITALSIATVGTLAGVVRFLKPRRRFDTKRFVIVAAAVVTAAIVIVAILWRTL